MTPDEWEQIKSVFDVALQRPASERAAWLDQVCADRPEMRATVEQLLRNFSEAGSFLESPVASTSRLPSFSANELVANRFRVVRLIATGGMGEVYDVFDERLRVRVALKTIRTDLATSSEIYERFKREVWVTRDVVHEGICRVFELIEHRSSNNPNAPLIPCLTMKLLDGHDLQSELKSRRPLPLEDALDITRQICSALLALHNSGIIHRDLKPSNIMLLPRADGKFRVVLTDFGLARPLDETTIFQTKSDNGKPGAPYFQAPEVLRGKRESIESDIYALGLVIDEMVTNSRAFTADSIHGLYWQKLWEKPIPPSSRASRLPPRWEQVILRCLKPQPAERYSSAMEVIRHLESPHSSTDEIEGRRSRAGVRGAAVGFLDTAFFSSAAVISLLAALLVFSAFKSQPLTASIAVLPTVNNTKKADSEYVARGIHTELVRRLRGVRQLHVYEMPALSAHSLVPSTERVQFSLQSRLAADSGRLKLVLALGSNSETQTLWSSEFESSLADSLVLETRASDALLSAIQLYSQPRVAGLPLTGLSDDAPLLRAFHLLTGRAFQLPANATGSSAAFQVYTRGRYLLEDHTEQSVLKAAECFQEAVRLEPNFALAWAGIADANQTLMEFAVGFREDIYERARDAAEHAVALGPELPETQTALAAVLQIAWEWDRARLAYERAVQFNPRFARAQRWYGGLLLQLGRTDEALEKTRLALELDPWDYSAHSAYGGYLFLAGKPQQAFEHLQRTLAEKDHVMARVNLGVVCAYLTGMTQGPERANYLSLALEEAGRIRQHETSGTAVSPPAAPSKWANFIPALAYAYAGDSASVMPWLNKLEEGRLSGHISAVTVSSVYAAMKDINRSLDLLEMAAAYHDRELTNIRVLPYFEPLRGHPRFEALLKRIGLGS